MGTFENLLQYSLPTPLRMKLVRSLNSGNRWKRIIEGLQSYRLQVFLDVNEMNELVRRKQTSPADWVLNELIIRNCSFDEFCFMLRQFDLLEELALLIPAEIMVIEVQPGNGEDMMYIGNGEELQLNCIASGVPRPTYQWYHDNDILQGQTSSVLSINPFSEEHIGIYWCEVKQELPGYESVKRSAEVEVDLMAEKPVLRKDLPGVCSVPRGQPVRLEVQAEAYPHPCYQWYRIPPDGTAPAYILPHETSNILQLAETGPEDEGIYLCRAYNKAGATDSRSCIFNVVENPPGCIARAKVALLVANENYRDEELQGLHAPSIDVATLAEILTDLGFHVIALQNLMHEEMHLAFLWFRSILPENAYAFFYFAGHGCSKLSSNCVMPIDCPKDKFQLSDVWCEEEIKQIFSNGRQLQLLVMLFDCCRLEASDLSIGSTKFEHDFGKCNVIVGTATRNYHNAYESDENSNGLFVNHLKGHLPDEKPIVDILQANQKEFQNEQQEPTLLTAGYRYHSLRDPIEDDPDIEQFLFSEVEFDCFGPREIYFNKTNEQFTICISKHKNCFLNSIDLEFPSEFSHNFSVQVNSEDVELKVERRIVTIYNIQRVKVPMSVTVFINGLRHADGGFLSGPHDSYKFDLDIPAILQRRQASLD